MIYLDNNASTQPDKWMLGKIVNEAGQTFGNPSSLHAQGYSARDCLENARLRVANALKAKPSEIIFTSGGTEANNLALSGFCKNYYRVVSSIEHSSVFNLGSQEVIDTMPDGTLNTYTFDFSKLNENSVVSVMLVNNETGVILDPLNRLFELKQKYGFILHIDAVQGFGKLPIDLSSGTIDLLTISGHKIHALKGIGALFVSRSMDRKNSTFSALMKGGPQEKGFRPGTENIIGASSLGWMAHLHTEDNQYMKRVKDVEIKRDKFESLLSDVSLRNGNTQHRVGNTTNLFFPDMPDKDVDLFIEMLSENGLCASGKSACLSGLPAPSRVLTEMYGDDAPRTHQSVRFSFSVNNTDEEVTKAATIVKNCLNRREV